MPKIIKLKGRYNDLELGTLHDGCYYPMGLLADKTHSWKILQWIATELEAGDKIEVVVERLDMMEESKKKNREAIVKVLGEAIEMRSPEELFSDPELVRIAKGQNSLEQIARK